MKNWNEVLVNPTDSIRTVVELIDKSSLQIALVVSEERKLLGTVTDGDIRRGILSGVLLENSIDTVMWTSPVTVSIENTREEILSLMKRKELRQIPVINNQGIIIGLETLVELVTSTTLPNHVVLMAGGLGKRLHPLTENCPKPLLKIGTRPILETIIKSFIEYGFKQFYLSVNYQADKIKKYFGKGEGLGVEIEYIEERKRLGTAGALSLIPKELEYPLLVMNADILTKVNFKHLLDFHIQHQSTGTMCVREYDLQVPYGVVNIEDGKILNIEEKPIQNFFVNAGIYILEPKALNFVPQNTFFDMPELFKKLTTLDHKTAAFPIHEYWLDIGQIEDFHKANGEFAKVFNP
jgi:dTDP-glucose pyrophosphorylase